MARLAMAVHRSETFFRVVYKGSGGRLAIRDTAQRRSRSFRTNSFSSSGPSLFNDSCWSRLRDIQSNQTRSPSCTAHTARHFIMPSPKCSRSLDLACKRSQGRSTYSPEDSSKSGHNSMRNPPCPRAALTSTTMPCLGSLRIRGEKFSLSPSVHQPNSLSAGRQVRSICTLRHPNLKC